ncbi:MAG TPA: hypothetical protein VK661_07900 [Planctomycetota bacterium]|nr:hypothetical protein [Planctomycetota bacterium]
MDAMLIRRPDDPDLLFLRHDHKDLARCARLASLRPTPVVLASVTSQFLAHGLDEETLPGFRNLLKVWMDRDPDNSMPLVLRGQLDISCGNLKEGLESLVRASQLRFLRTYSLEGQQEALRIQKQEGLTEVEYLATYGLHNLNLVIAVTKACSLLATTSGENHLRRNRGESQRLAEAEYRLARSFTASGKCLMEATLAYDAVSYAAECLCELHLMVGEDALASRYATESRHRHLAQRALKLAQEREVARNPITQLMKEVGLLKQFDSAYMKGVLDSLLAVSPSDLWNRLLVKMREVEGKDAWPRFYAKLRENEGRVRPYLESQIHRGYVEVALEGVTEEDRRSIESLKFPIDHFMEEKKTFYPERYGTEHRDRLIMYLTAADQGGDSELRDYLRERAAGALIHHDDKGALPGLCALLDAKGSSVSEVLVAVTMVALGDHSDRVIKILEEGFDVYQAGVCWAVAHLGRTKVIPELVREFELGVRPGQISNNFQEAVTAYFALKELTGQDFGFYPGKWSEWAERTGNKKK